MVGLQFLTFHLKCILLCLYLVTCSNLDVEDVINESKQIDSYVDKTNPTELKSSKCRLFFSNLRKLN